MNKNENYGPRYVCSYFTKFNMKKCSSMSMLFSYGCVYCAEVLNRGVPCHQQLLAAVRGCMMEVSQETCDDVAVRQ